VRPAKVEGFLSVVNVACKVDSAALKVPNADTCAVNEVLRLFSAFVWGALAALVSDETMLAMSSPDPMPWDDMRVLRAAFEVDAVGVLIGLGLSLGSVDLSAGRGGT